MKKYTVILVLMATSCGLLKDRSVNKSKQDVVIRENSMSLEKSPGDNITVYLPYPLSNPARPKLQDTIYSGRNGATLEVSFDSTGVVNRLEADCPEIDKYWQKNTELDYSLKIKQTESKANIEFAREIGKWIFFSVCAIGFLGTITVLGRTLILQK